MRSALSYHFIDLISYLLTSQQSMISCSLPFQRLSVLHPSPSQISVPPKGINSLLYCLEILLQSASQQRQDKDRQQTHDGVIRTSLFGPSLSQSQKSNCENRTKTTLERTSGTSENLKKHWQWNRVLDWHVRLKPKKRVRESVIEILLQSRSLIKGGGSVRREGEGMKQQSVTWW